MLMKYTGSCHCGRVCYEVEGPEVLNCLDCNCSICAKSGFLHYIVPKSKFRLLKGLSELKTYTFDTGEAKHLFCDNCGIKSFYIPRSNPDGIDVNVRCLSPQPRQINVERFDGQNWERNAEKLQHLSKETQDV
jgi:hypothetical protein